MFGMVSKMRTVGGAEQRNIRTHAQGSDDEAKDNTFDGGEVDAHFAQPGVHAEIQDRHGYDDCQRVEVAEEIVRGSV